MQNKIFLTAILIVTLSFVSLAKDLPSKNNVPNLLSQANKLKHAEKYEDAEKLYDTILITDPENKEALQGKDDCRIMIEPVIPMQHIAVPLVLDDPEYLRVLEMSKKAKTPWDKRRAELAHERYAVKYTGKVFGEAREEFEKRAERILRKARKKVAKGYFTDKAYLEADTELRNLQKRAHQGWKGHGPEILEPALKELNEFYQENNYPNPSHPLTLSFETSPEVTEKGQVVGLTVTLKNKSSFPIILMDLQLGGLRYRTFSWQKAMYGSLIYDNKKNLYYYNGLAQQETYNHFNQGLLFPGQSLSFNKKARIPEPTPAVIVSFVILDDETLKNVYVAKDFKGMMDEYVPADLKKLKSITIDKRFTFEDARFPSRGAIVFDNQGSPVREQLFFH